MNAVEIKHLAPSVMSIGSVCFTKLMKVLLTFYNTSLVVRSVQKLKRHLIGKLHPQFLFPGGFDQPLAGQVVRRLFRHWDRNLITYTASLNRGRFKDWSAVFDGHMENLHRISFDAGLLFFGLCLVVLLQLQSLDVLEGSLHQITSKLLLALNHDVVSELVNSFVVKNAARVVVEGGFDGKMLHLSGFTGLDQRCLFLFLKYGIYEMGAVH